MPVPRQPQRSEALEERNHGFLIFSTLLPTHAPRKASKMKPYFKWSPEALRRERIHIPPAAACITSREKEENSYLNRGGHFSCRSLSCWGGRGGDDLPQPQQLRASDVLQPARNRHDLELLRFSEEFLFKTTLPDFLIEPVRADLPPGPSDKPVVLPGLAGPKLKFSIPKILPCLARNMATFKVFIPHPRSVTQPSGLTKALGPLS